MGLAVASRRLLGFGVALFDADNDGRLDLASANGHVNDLRPNYPYLMPAQLLISGVDGRLTDVSDRAGAPWTVPRMGRGLAVGDLDNDGRLDVLILSHNQPLAYLHNRTEARSVPDPPAGGSRLESRRHRSESRGHRGRPAARRPTSWRRQLPVGIRPTSPFRYGRVLIGSNRSRSCGPPDASAVFAT